MMNEVCKIEFCDHFMHGFRHVRMNILFILFDGLCLSRANTVVRDFSVALDLIRNIL
jgi:hypothetical protein